MGREKKVVKGKKTSSRKNLVRNLGINPSTMSLQPLSNFLLSKNLVQFDTEESNFLVRYKKLISSLPNLHEIEKKKVISAPLWYAWNMKLFKENLFQV